MNPMLMIDGYKLDHRRQYPENTTRVYSNWTPRASRIPGQNDVVFFGLQYFLQHYLVECMEREFFNISKHQLSAEYVDFVNNYLGPNTIGFEHLSNLHSLGYLPLEFRALPEGTLCPLRVPMLTVENTHDDFAWLVNYIETIMSNMLWMPCTSATLAYRMRQLLNNAAKNTGGPLDFVQWQGHDFSMRGMPGLEAAQLSGAGHLLSFTGTDTIPAILLINKYYHGNNGLVGGSVAATEHSVASAGGKDGEQHTLERILELYPSGIVSFVSDTWDLWHLITHILPSLKNKIMSRDGKLVIRPDSGDPVDIICGNINANEGTPEFYGVIELLWNIFGGTTNEQGYKQLNPHIGVIYGDAITYDRCQEICNRLERKNFASTNMVFGVGSYTYQFVTRDVFGFAMKATFARINGQPVDLFKQPVTDNGVKFSARGRLAVQKHRGVLQGINCATPEQEQNSMLAPVWRDGKFIHKYSFADVRRNLWGA